MKEYQFYDGECWITFDIVHRNPKRNEILIAVTNRGKISVITFDLYGDDENPYIEYGPTYEKIYVGLFS